MDRQGVRAGRGFQVDVKAAIERRSAAAVKAPSASTVGLEHDLAPTLLGPTCDSCSPRAPGAIYRNHVADDPRVAAFDSRRVPHQLVTVVLAAGKDRLEACARSLM
jgi:hypothetical protein